MKAIVLLLGFSISIGLYGQDAYYITSADQNQLYVEEFGAGAPVLLLSGGPGFDPKYMEPVWETLGKDHRVIVLHQRGAGKSTLAKVDSTTMAMENFHNDIEALRKHLELEKMTLVGHSWGGMLAMDYTAKHPDKVEKLVLLGPGGPTIKFTSYFMDNINMRLQTADGDEVKALVAEGKPPFSGMWPGYFFDRQKALQHKSATDFETFYGAPGGRDLTIAEYFANEAQRVSGLKTYGSAVHIIQGRQDPIGESTVYEIAAILPQAQIHFVEKSGHYPWAENEPQVADFYRLLSIALEGG